MEAEKSKLQEALEGEFECRSYSGRGMYGKSCLGVDIGRGDLGEVIACIAEAAIQENEDGGGHRSFIVEDVRRFSMDSMGLGTIVYFPGVEYVGEEDECEEDEEATA